MHSFSCIFNLPYRTTFFSIFQLKDTNLYKKMILEWMFGSIWYLFNWHCFHLIFTQATFLHNWLTRYFIRSGISPAIDRADYDGTYLNNRVLLSRNYRLIVAPRKFDVLKTNISLRGKFASFKKIKFPRGNYQTDYSETKTLYCHYCSTL